MNNTKKSKKITGIALLAALEVALCFISNYLTIGSININLALLPIVVASIYYGPVEGMIIGIINGLITLIAPATLGLFIPYNAIGTIITCITKTGVAGLLSGFVYKFLVKYNESLAIVTAAFVVPLINTGIFIGFIYVFFKGIEMYNGKTFQEILELVISINFLIEAVSTPILSYPIVKAIQKKAS